jgi:hypothetical protein
MVYIDFFYGLWVLKKKENRTKQAFLQYYNRICGGICCEIICTRVRQ